MNNPNSHVLETHDLRKTFKEGKLNVSVLHGINLSVKAGEKIAIIGSSGSGKSTLLHLLGGLDTPTAGEVIVHGKTMSSLSDTARGKLRNDSIGFIYQFHHLLPEFTALENVALPQLIAKKSIAQAQDRARELLQRVGLGERLEHKPGELSGGERQRTAIARALANNPELILADEPTGNLDQKTAEDIYQLMAKLNTDMKTAFIVVTHDLNLANRMDRIYHLENGVLAAE